MEKQNVAKLLLSRGGLKETTAFQAGVNSVETVFLSKEDISYYSPPLKEKKFLAYIILWQKLSKTEIYLRSSRPDLHLKTKIRSPQGF